MNEWTEDDQYEGAPPMAVGVVGVYTGLPEMRGFAFVDDEFINGQTVPPENPESEESPTHE